MLRFRRPTDAAIRAFLREQEPLALTYDGIGATAGVPPAGYVVDHTRVALGRGDVAFAAARAAIGRWEQFRLGWVEPYPADTPVCAGAIVGVLARICGAWWLNAARIVYTVDEAGLRTAFGFAYGTLPGHAESGEERFLVEWDRATGVVSYDVLAFSRPRHILARLGYPLARRTQKRFARDSAAAMRRAVAAGTGPASP